MFPIRPAATSPGIEVRCHGDFVPWLAQSRGTLAVTTYNSGKLALFCAPDGVLECSIVRLPRPMGLAFDGQQLAVAVRRAIVVWNSAETRADARFAYRPFRLHGEYPTGRLDAHDLAFDSRGLVLANTRFNCLARPSRRARYRRLWRPPFLRESAAGDCCHLNGVGVRDGQPALATAFGVAVEAGGWRTADRFHSGVALDVPTGRIVAEGLCMPHSPRWDGRQWWLCNSGLGALCRLDGRGGACETVAELPGFVRGLYLAEDRAVVGLSRIRRRHILDAPPVRARFPRLRSGAWLVDRDSGATTGALEFVRGGREVFETALLPSVVRPLLTPWAEAGSSPVEDLQADDPEPTDPA